MVGTPAAGPFGGDTFFVSVRVWRRAPDENPRNKAGIRQHSEEYRSCPDGRRSSFRSWHETVLDLLSRPRIAVATTMVAAFAGVAVGTRAARSDNATAYLRSVNPYAQLSDVR